MTTPPQVFATAVTLCVGPTSWGFGGSPCVGDDGEQVATYTDGETELRARLTDVGNAWTVRVDDDLVCPGDAGCALRVIDATDPTASS